MTGMKTFESLFVAQITPEVSVKQQQIIIKQQTFIIDFRISNGPLFQDFFLNLRVSKASGGY